MDEEIMNEATPSPSEPEEKEKSHEEKIREEVASILSDTPLVYCGPSKPKMGLKKFSIFYGGLTPEYHNAIDAVPELIKLIVPYPELEDMRAKIEKAGTPEHEYYVKIDNAV